MDLGIAKKRLAITTVALSLLTGFLGGGILAHLGFPVGASLAWIASMVTMYAGVAFVTWHRLKRGQQKFFTVRWLALYLAGTFVLWTAGIVLVACSDVGFSLGTLLVFGGLALWTAFSILAFET